MKPILSCITGFALLLSNVSTIAQPAKKTTSKTDILSISHALQKQATPLKFDEFFDAKSTELKPTAKIVSLNGKHVCLTGFMAKMDEPPKGYFYLCPTPIFSDEEGGGTADLPPVAVKVIVRSMKNQDITYIPRAVVVTGKFEMGNKTDDNGQVSSFRLILDSPNDLKTKAVAQSSAKQ